jgi:hypothetical protein
MPSRHREEDETPRRGSKLMKGGQTNIHTDVKLYLPVPAFDEEDAEVEAEPGPWRARWPTTTRPVLPNTSTRPVLVLRA